MTHGEVRFGLRRANLAAFVVFEDDDGGSSAGGITLTILTSGGAVWGAFPATLPLRCSIRACCCCFRLIMDLTCSKAFGSSPRIVKPITTGEMPLSTEGRLTSVLMPLMVIRLFLLGLGEEEEDGVWLASHGFCRDDTAGSGGSRLSVSASCLTLTVLGDRRPLRCRTKPIENANG